MILECLSDERRGLAADQSVWHISEIVPLILAKVRTETPLAWESRMKANLSPSHMMPNPSVSACV